jgi:hypothetical protein
VLEEETALIAETDRAMRELARTVTDAPPLRLAPGRAARAPRPARQRRWTLWAVPLTAAVAVIALAVALVTIKDLPNARVVPPTAPASSSAAGVPAYYAAPELLCKTCGSAILVVGDTFTGAKLATFSPPRGTTFEAVSAAADDRTFVAETVGYPFDPDFETQHVTWYLLKITPGASTPVRLTRLPIPGLPPAAMIGTVVLSPSGGELAVTYQFRDPTPVKDVLRIYSVATGKLLNSWSTTLIPDLELLLAPFGFVSSMQSNNQLSWVDGGRALSFTTISYTSSVLVAVRTLKLTTGGGNLIRDSRVVWSMQSPISGASTCASQPVTVPWITADGKTVVCTQVVADDPGDRSEKTRQAWQLTWLAYQTADPKAAKAARTLYKFTAYSTGSQAEGFSSVQWADATGSTMIIAWTIQSSTSSALHFGVVSHGRFTPLPTPPSFSLIMPPDIAW